MDDVFVPYTAVEKAVAVLLAANNQHSYGIPTQIAGVTNSLSFAVRIRRIPILMPTFSILSFSTATVGIHETHCNSQN